MPHVEHTEIYDITQVIRNLTYASIGQTIKCPNDTTDNRNTVTILDRQEAILWCYFWSTYNILPLEDDYKAKGYLKMSCNVLANIKEHYMSMNGSFSSLYADDTFQFSAVTKDSKVFSLWLPTGRPAGKANGPSLFFFSVPPFYGGQ